MLLLFEFSAFGELRTGLLFLEMYQGIFGKGALFAAPQLKGCLIGLIGSSTQTGTGCINLQLIGSSVADCQALT